MKLPVFDGNAGCAAIAQSLGETGVGRAGLTRGWLLLEHAGGWPKDPFAGGGFDAAVLATLADRVRGLSIRILAIRRPLGRKGRPCPQRNVYLAHSGPGQPWREHRTIDDDRELLDVDIASLATAQATGWGQREDTPLYLVCTHATKDACCGIRGRPLAQALARLRGEQVWECSHVGGDRFAANLVCLPEGLYYGHVDALAGARIVEAHQRGRLDLDHLRGRSCHDPLVQAAEHLLRRHLGLLGIDDLAPVSLTRLAGKETEVVLEGSAGRFVVRICATRTGTSRPTGCGTLSLGDPGTYELQSWRSTGSPGPGCGPPTRGSATASSGRPVGR